MKSEVFFLPAGFKLVLTADAVAAGYYYVKGNPGTQPGPLTTITPNSTYTVGPFNDPRSYGVDVSQGNVSVSIEFHYVEDADEETLALLSDVNITSPMDQDILEYNSTSEKWENKVNVGGGAETLDDLTDVHIVTPADGEALIYNSGVWSNSSVVTDLSEYSKTVDFADVAFSGDYNDLSNTPTLGTMAAETASDYSKTVAFDNVAFSGAYADLSGTPDLSGYASKGANTDITSVYLNNTGLKVKDTDASHGLIFKPNSDITADRTLKITTGDSDRNLTFTADASIGGTNTGDQDLSAYTKSADLDDVAFSGDYNDLINTPTLGTMAAETAADYSKTVAFDDVAFSGAYGDLSGTPDLSGYAAKGANTDITSIYLNNTGLKVKDTNASHGLIFKPGSDITADRTFTVTTGDANRTLTMSADATISGTNTGDQDLSAYAKSSSLATVATTGAYSDLTGTPTISGTNTGDQLVFKTISVSGQSDVVADTTTDTLTLVGSGVTITTDASTDTVTYTVTRAGLGAAASGANTDITSLLLDYGGLYLHDSDASNKTRFSFETNMTKDCNFAIYTGNVTSRNLDMSAGDLSVQGDTVVNGIFSGTSSGTNTGDQVVFKTISVSGQSDVVADTSTDTLTLVGSGLTITTNATTDTITFTNSYTGDLLSSNNLSDVSNKATAATNLGLGTGDSPQFTAINVGHATDTTITRTGAGDIAVEGNAIYRAGGTDVPITDGGTGKSTQTAAYDALSPNTTQGDIEYHNGTNNVRLAIGTSGYVLASNGAGANPSWQDLAYSDEKVDDRVNALFQTGCNISWTYNDGSNTFTPVLVTGPGYVSGNYYIASGIGHVVSSTAQSRTTTTGTLYFFPFYCMSTQAFTKIATFVVTGSAASNCNMGIYADAGGVPTGSPLANSTSGSVSTASSSTLASYTFSQAITLTGNTWYWLALTDSSSTPAFASTGNITSTLADCCINGLGSPSFTGSYAQTIAYTQSFTYSTTLPSVGTLTAFSGAGDKLIFVALQV